MLGNILRFSYHNILNRSPSKIYTKHRYRRKTGKALNLTNPKDLNEKINWLKLYDRSPLHTQCADKYAVREYVSEKIGERYLVPLYFHTKDPKKIIPENINQIPCIIKTNHDSGGGIFVYQSEGNDWEQIQKELTDRLEINYYKKYREWQYKNIEPRIIVEKLLLDESGKIPMDYKIHCFNGRPEIIQIDLDRFSDHKRNLYDPNWNLLPFTWSVWENNKPLWDNGKQIPRPRNLEELINLAMALSSEFIYARIDFYELNECIYFGEITFHPGSGFETIHPEKWAKILGERLKLPKKI